MKDMSGSLPKALKIIEYMSEKQQNVSFKSLKEHTGFASNVLSRLLKTYIEWDYILKGEGNGLYSLGPQMYGVCERVLGRRPRKDAVIPILNGLAAGLQESAAYFDYDGEWMTLLAKAEVANSYHYLETMSRDVHSPINGFFFTALAFLPNDKRQEILNKRSDRYGYGEAELQSKFREIHETHIYVSKELFRRSQITRICSPVFEGEGKGFAGVLGVTVIAHDLQPDDLSVLTKTVRDSAETATAML